MQSIWAFEKVIASFKVPLRQAQGDKLSESLKQFLKHSSRCHPELAEGLP